MTLSLFLRAVVRFLKKVKRAIIRLLPFLKRRRWSSVAYADYELLGPVPASIDLLDGWRDHAVVERQDSAYQALLRQMYDGAPRQDLMVAAEAVHRTEVENPYILEVGCGSGYYNEILSHLLQRPMHYMGLDYSLAMIQKASRNYTQQSFVVGDATALPLANESFDIVLNGVSLMHILRYKAAIAESRRVARRWCIFHTVPILRQRETTVLRKKAYGESVVEVIFNEGELLGLMEQNGLVVHDILDSVPYNVEAVVGEATLSKTYLCKVGQR